MTLTTYRNFDLLLTRAGERYRAFVVDAPAGEDSVIFDPPRTCGRHTLEHCRCGQTSSARAARRPAPAEGLEPSAVAPPTGACHMRRMGAHVTCAAPWRM